MIASNGTKSQVTTYFQRVVARLLFPKRSDRGSFTDVRSSRRGDEKVRFAVKRRRINPDDTGLDYRYVMTCRGPDLRISQMENPHNDYSYLNIAWSLDNDMSHTGREDDLIF